MAPTIASPTLAIRDARNRASAIAAEHILPMMVRDAHPYREFRWYLGQPHYSGCYWSSTESKHVIYESRLELSRLLMADFDPMVTKIVAQPFLVRAKINGKARRHIPDYWLLTADGPVVVDVKPAARLDDPVVIATFEWARIVIESIGWRFEIATEQPAVKLENVRFLAGYRRADRISQAALKALRASNLDGLQFRDAVKRAPQPEPIVRAALLHMLWTDELTIDLSEVLCSTTVLNTTKGIVV
jgi:hypothetical protein